jgi:hypothetical protein
VSVSSRKLAEKILLPRGPVGTTAAVVMTAAVVTVGVADDMAAVGISDVVGMTVAVGIVDVFDREETDVN